jgi:hypothetical protein
MAGEFVQEDAFQADAFQQYNADVTIDDSIDNELHAGQVRGGPYWKSALIGYIIYIDGNHELVWSKTTDGGANWSAAVEFGFDSIVAVDAWADWQTPGDEGTVIHIICHSCESNNVEYVWLDTSDDSDGSDTIVACQGTGSFQTTIARAYSFCTISKTCGGNIVVVGRYHDNADTNHEYAYKSADGDTWTSITSPLEGNDDDTFLAFPANLTDEDDWWLLFHDSNVYDLSLKTYDDSGDSWDEDTIDADIVSITTYIVFGGAVRLSDGHLIVCAWTEWDSATSDLKCWDITDGDTITAKTNVRENSAESFQAAIMVTSSKIFVAYIRGTGLGSACKVYYDYSEDGGANWEGEQSYQENAEDDMRYLSAGAPSSSGTGLFLPIFSNDDLNDLFCSTTNAVALAVNYEESASVSVGVAVSASRLPNYPRSAAVSVGALVSASRIPNYLKQVAVSIGVLVSPKRALSFNGEGDYVAISGDGEPLESLTDDGNDFSFECWYKPSGTPKSNDGYIFFRAGYHLGFCQSFYNMLNAYLWYFDTTPLGIFSNLVAQVGQWYHLVMTVDETANEFKFYINGTQYGGTKTIAKALRDYGTADYKIMDDGSWGAWGTVDEVLIYSRVLMADEIAYNYNNGEGRRTPYNQAGLEGWWHIDEGAGSTIADSSGNGNDGTIYGATWAEGIVTQAWRIAAFARSAAVSIGALVTANRQVNYPRAASVIVGAVVTAARAFGAAVSAAVSTGVLVTASRAAGFVRSAAVSIGSLVTASRAIGIQRAAAVSVGALVSAARAIAASRAASVITGVVVTATRLPNYPRAAPVIVGVVITATRAVAASRAAAVIVGIAVTASKIFGIAKAAAVSVGTLVTASRAFTITRSAALSVGVLVSATRSAAVTRASSVIVGILATASRLPNYPRSAAVSIGVVVTASRVYAAVRSAAISIGVVITASVTAAATRAAAVAIGVVASAIRSIAAVRASAVAVGVAVTASALKANVRSAAISIGTLVTASRQYAAVRSSSVLVGVTVTASRAVAIIRQSSVLIGVVVTATKSFGKVTAAAVSIGVKVTASRITAFVRSASVIVGAVVTASRAVAAIRSANVIIGVVVTAARSIATSISSSVSVGVLVTASRAITWVKSAAVSIGTVVTAARTLAATRAASVIVGVVVTATVSIGAYTKAAAVSIGVAVTASRAVMLTRSASVIVGVKVAASAIIRRILSIVTTIAQALGITSDHSTGLIITPSISSGLTVTGNIATEYTVEPSIGSGLTITPDIKGG